MSGPVVIDRLDCVFIPATRPDRYGEATRYICQADITWPRPEGGEAYICQVRRLRPGKARPGAWRKKPVGDDPGPAVVIRQRRPDCEQGASYELRTRRMTSRKRRGLACPLLNCRRSIRASSDMSEGNKPWLTPPEFCRANRTRSALGLAKKGEIKICVRQGVQVAYGRQAGRAGLKAWIKTRPAEVASAIADAAQAAHVATSERGLEIELSEGGRVFFISDEGGFCAGGVTDDADPELIKTMSATLASLGLPLHSIAAEKAPDGVAEVTRLYAKGKQG